MMEANRTRKVDMRCAICNEHLGSFHLSGFDLKIFEWKFIGTHRTLLTVREGLYALCGDDHRNQWIKDNVDIIENTMKLARERHKIDTNKKFPVEDDDDDDIVNMPVDEYGEPI